MKITAERPVEAPIASGWRVWSTPQNICAWNAASDDWCATGASVDRRVEFAAGAERVTWGETFDAGSTFPAEVQRQGWQAILDKFARHVEAGRADAAGVPKER